MIAWLQYQLQRVDRVWLAWRNPVRKLAGTSSSRPYRTWRTLRKHWIKANPQCSMCGTTKKSVLEVHHLLPRHVAPERALDWDNLITLCKRDHFVHGHNRNYRRYFIPNIREIAGRFVSARHVADTKLQED